MTVEDNDQGIPPEMLEGVFYLFSQGDAGRNQGGGLGIGLAVARAGARTPRPHRGDSEGVGRGSRFTLRLPPAAEPLQARSSMLPATRKAAVGRRVLIADEIATPSN